MGAPFLASFARSGTFDFFDTTSIWKMFRGVDWLLTLGGAETYGLLNPSALFAKV